MSAATKVELQIAAQPSTMLRLDPEGRWIMVCPDCRKEHLRVQGDDAQLLEVVERQDLEIKRLKEANYDLARQNLLLISKADTLQKQLPESMQGCTIVFRECERGHGWLTATNWVQYGCPTCERDALRETVQRWEARYADMLQRHREYLDKSNKDLEEIRDALRNRS